MYFIRVPKTISLYDLLLIGYLGRKPLRQANALD